MKNKKYWIGGALLTLGAAVIWRHSNSYQRFVDATARKPSGWLGRALYRDPKPHYRSFQQVLEKLRLTPDDFFLDVCCGGGTLLQMALKTVRRAAGLDYSPDMIALTRENNASAVKEGRLDLRQGDAAALPWDDGTFDAAANVNALIFVPEPLAFFREIYRVLKPGGCFAVVTAPKHKLAPILFGPWYATLKLYADDELAAMLQSAGFSEVSVCTLGVETQVGYGVK
ncbi:MAG: methyltransferase domain-containing protein [Anaerolineae bacterium]|nr:methyltransferase domain-containing protein [Anaerolineae bacterium]